MTEKTEWIRHLRDESRSLRLEAEQFLSQSKATLEESIRDIENGNNELRKKFQRKVLTDDAVEKIVGKRTYAGVEQRPKFNVVDELTRIKETIEAEKAELARLRQLREEEIKKVEAARMEHEKLQREEKRAKEAAMLVAEMQEKEEELRQQKEQERLAEETRLATFKQQVDEKLAERERLRLEAEKEEEL